MICIPVWAVVTAGVIVLLAAAFVLWVLLTTVSDFNFDEKEHQKRREYYRQLYEEAIRKEKS